VVPSARVPCRCRKEEKPEKGNPDVKGGIE